MVLKVKSEETIKPLKNVSSFTAWTMPSLDNGDAPGFRQPVDDAKSTKSDPRDASEIAAEELKAVRDAAYQEGFNSGRDQGMAAAKNSIDQLTQTFTGLINSLNEPLKQCGEQTQQQLLELAFAIARQIVRRELSQDPTQLIATIREAVGMLPIGEQKISISLHPEDAKIVNSSLSINEHSTSSRWQINEDPSIERGGCQIATQNSKIDASIDKQVAVLFSRIAGGLRAGEGAPNEEPLNESASNKSLPSKNEPGASHEDGSHAE